MPAEKKTILVFGEGGAGKSSICKSIAGTKHTDINEDFMVSAQNDQHESCTKASIF